MLNLEGDIIVLDDFLRPKRVAHFMRELSPKVATHFARTSIAGCRILVQCAPDAALLLCRCLHEQPYDFRALFQVVEVAHDIPYAVNEHSVWLHLVDGCHHLLKTHMDVLLLAQIKQPESLISTLELPAAQIMDSSGHLERVIEALLRVYEQDTRLMPYTRQDIHIEPQTTRRAAAKDSRHELNQDKRLAVLLAAGYRLDVADGGESYAVKTQKIQGFLKVQRDVYPVL